jgi:hypothetical protein
MVVRMKGKALNQDTFPTVIGSQHRSTLKRNR